MERLNDIQALALYLAIAIVTIIGIFMLMTAPLHPAAILALMLIDAAGFIIATEALIVPRTA